MHPQSALQKSSGFTLIELSIVLAIVAVAFSLYFFMADKTTNEAMDRAARTSLAVLGEAIVGSPERPGFRDDVGEIPTRLEDLFDQPAALLSGKPVQPFDPSTKRGWNGPYIHSWTTTYEEDVANGFTSEYGSQHAPALHDPWGKPFILQIPTSATTYAEQEASSRLVSAGPNHAIETPLTALAPDPTSPAEVGDDIVHYLFGNRP